MFIMLKTKKYKNVGGEKAEVADRTLLQIVFVFCFMQMKCKQQIRSDFTTEKQPPSSSLVSA